MSDFTTPEDCETSVMAQPAATHSGLQSLAWPRLVLVFGLWIAVAALYWPSSVALDGLWRSPTEETYTHGYLVLLISLWLIARSRGRLAATPAQPAPGALVVLALLSVLWLWAWRAAIQELHLLLLPLLLFAALVAALGWRVGRLLAFPVGYLYFAMPLWDNINGFVRALSSRATGALIWITGLPAYMHGNYIELPGGSIEIANSCSGLHALIVGLALATLYGEIARDPRRRRIEWLIVMGILSVVVNWVRIFIVIAAASATDMHSSLVKSHYWLGWWLFAGAFALFLWWAGRRTSHAPHPQKAGQPATGDEPLSDHRIGVARVALVLGVLAVLPVLSYAMDWTHSTAPVTIHWPTAPQGWKGPHSAGISEWHPRFIHPSGASLRAYTDADGRSVEVFAVGYRVQTQSGKLLGYHNNLLSGTPALRSVATRIVTSSTGRWRQTLAVDPATGVRSVIWSRYRIGSHLFVDPRLSQLWYGLKALAHPPLSSLIALRAVCASDCRAAEARVSTAAAKLRPTLR